VRWIWGILCSLSLVTIAQAQINHPKASPLTTISQDVGLSNIQVVYSRPAVRGRVIFGDLVPYGRIWRVGANAATKITVDTDVTIMENRLPKGTYVLYAFPHETHWEIVFHTNTSHWGDGRTAYDATEDAFRIKVIPEKTSTLQENFLITFDNITHNGLTMLWLWEHTRIRIPIEVPTVTKMREEIRNQIEENPSAQTYYEAARYLQEQELEYDLALSYLKKAIMLGGDTYYFHRALAAKEGKDEFVRMNEKNIDRWTLEHKKMKK